jgi:hypothetical protein
LIKYLETKFGYDEKDMKQADSLFLSRKKMNLSGKHENINEDINDRDLNLSTACDHTRHNVY